MDKPNDIVNKRLSDFEKKIVERNRSNVIQLPIWPEPRRGTPNSFIRSALFSAIQSKDRVFMKEVVVASQKGITVKYTGEQLNQEDLTLWETLVHLSKDDPLGNKCVFTAHKILKAMNISPGGDQHKQLHSAIIRLTACAVEITHEDKTYFGSLIKSGAKDELTSHYSIELNRELIRLYGNTQWTAIEWNKRQALRRKPLAQALHAYYSSHRTPYPVKLSTLQRLTGSKNKQAAGFKRQVLLALKELVTISFLKSYSLEGDIIIVKREL